VIWRILCYHAVQPVEEASFRAQLRYWLKKGWRFCTVTEGLRLSNIGVCGRWITVTFDDGDATVTQVAQPVLDELGIHACLYVATDYILRGWTYRDDQPRPAATWQQLRAWVAAGHEVGSHTHTHAPLPRCHSRRIEQELLVSRQILEDSLGSTVEHLSFPWGQWDQRVCAAAAEAGYRSLATIDRGVNRCVETPALLHRDLFEPAWSSVRVRLMIGWGRTPLYRLQRRVRKVPGYWDRHPEETWGPWFLHEA